MLHAMQNHDLKLPVGHEQPETRAMMNFTLGHK